MHIFLYRRTIISIIPLFICLLTSSLCLCVLECSTESLAISFLTLSLPFHPGEFVLRELPTQVQPGRGAEGVGGRAGGNQPRPERPEEERRGDGSGYRWSGWGGRGEDTVHKTKAFSYSSGFYVEKQHTEQFKEGPRPNETTYHVSFYKIFPWMLMRKI